MYIYICVYMNACSSILPEALSELLYSNNHLFVWTMIWHIIWNKTIHAEILSGIYPKISLTEYLIKILNRILIFGAKERKQRSYPVCCGKNRQRKYVATMAGVQTWRQCSASSHPPRLPAAPAALWRASRPSLAGKVTSEEYWMFPAEFYAKLLFDTKCPNLAYPFCLL